MANFKEIVELLSEIVSDATVVIVALAFLTFLWGLARFILSAGDEKAIDDGKKIMLWGTIALFVMVSVWGIVEILERTFFG
jgi:hypothetical protein